MSDEPRRAVHLRHPILQLDVLGPDGRRQSEYRVFCRYQQRSVPVTTCCNCAHADSIAIAPTPMVSCTVFVDGPKPPDDLGVRTPVATLLRNGTVVLEDGSTISDALHVLRVERRASVAIVDAEHAVIGSVHETTVVLPAGCQALDLAKIMSTSVTIHESTPIRRALQILAGAHLREAVVVDDANVPLGVFRDIDGLHWIGHHQSET